MRSAFVQEAIYDLVGWKLRADVERCGEEVWYIEGACEIDNSNGVVWS